MDRYAIASILGPISPLLVREITHRLAIYVALACATSFRAASREPADNVAIFIEPESICKVAIIRHEP